MTTSSDDVHSDSSKSSSSKSHWKTITKLSTFVVILGLIGVAFWLFRDQLSLKQLAQREVEFQQYRTTHPALVYVVAFLIYVVVTSLSLPGAAPMTIVMGWLFGFWRAVLLVSFASTMGASIAFLLSRYLLREVVQKNFGNRLESVNVALKRDGAFYLFSLRLVPVIPFFVINLVMGLTPISLWTFWLISQVGMLPGTAVFVYAGSSVPDLQTLADRGIGGILTPQVIIAFIVLGFFPIAVKKVFSRFVSKDSDTEKNEDA